MHPPSTAPPSTPKRRGARLERWLRVGLAALLILVVVRLLSADSRPLRELGRVRSSLLAGMTLLMLANQVLSSWRFSLVMERCTGARVSNWEWFRLTSIAQFLNLFVPQLGNVQRAISLQQGYGVSYLAYGTGLLVSVWLDILAGLLLASLVLAVFARGLSVGSIPALALVAGASAVLAAAPWLLHAALERTPFQATWAQRMRAGTRALLAAAGAAVSSPGFLGRLFGLNLLVAVAHVTTFWLAFSAVGRAIGLERLVLFQVLARLSNQIPLTPGNLGFTELAYAALAEGSSAGLQSGIAVALLIRVLGTALIVILGVSLGGIPLLRAKRRVAD